MFLIGGRRRAGDFFSVVEDTDVGERREDVEVGFSRVGDGEDERGSGVLGVSGVAGVGGGGVGREGILVWDDSTPSVDVRRRVSRGRFILDEKDEREEENRMLVEKLLLCGTEG